MASSGLAIRILWADDMPPWLGGQRHQRGCAAMRAGAEDEWRGLCISSVPRLLAGASCATGGRPHRHVQSRGGGGRIELAVQRRCKLMADRPDIVTTEGLQPESRAAPSVDTRCVTWYHPDAHGKNKLDVAQ